MNPDMKSSFYFDESDGRLKRAVKHYCMRPGDNAGDIGPRGYGQVSFNGKRHCVHKVIYFLFNGWVPENVDHIDGNPFNNMPDNLRAATFGENSRNRKTQKNNKIGFRGVKFMEGGWVANICADGKTRYLGYHQTLIDAVAARIRGEKEYHGEFRRR